jgi:hypothetical protein
MLREINNVNVLSSTTVPKGRPSGSAVSAGVLVTFSR